MRVYVFATFLYISIGGEGCSRVGYLWTLRIRLLLTGADKPVFLRSMWLTQEVNRNEDIRCKILLVICVTDSIIFPFSGFTSKPSKRIMTTERQWRRPCLTEMLLHIRTHTIQIHSTLTHPTTYSQRVDDESSLQAYQVTVTYRAAHVLGLEWWFGGWDSR